MTSYLEIRTFTLEQMPADVVQHWQSRRRLGPALVVCTDPATWQSQLSHHWQQLTHHLQAKRNKTLATDELLRLTHQISEMQKTPITTNASGSAGIHCTTAEEIGAMDLDRKYYSVYVLTQLNESQGGLLTTFLQDQSLVTAYQPYAAALQCLNLQPKTLLYDQLVREWHDLQEYLQQYNIDIVHLSTPDEKRAHYINEALDTLLASPAGQVLLPLAAQFKTTRELAQPTYESPRQRRFYDTMMVLARHVQAWSMSSDRSLHMGIDDPMFFNDPNRVRAGQFSVAYSEVDQLDQVAQWHSAELFAA